MVTVITGAYILLTGFYSPVFINRLHFVTRFIIIIIIIIIIIYNYYWANTP